MVPLLAFASYTAWIEIVFLIPICFPWYNNRKHVREKHMCKEISMWEFFKKMLGGSNEAAVRKLAKTVNAIEA